MAMRRETPFKIGIGSKKGLFKGRTLASLRSELAKLRKLKKRTAKQTTRERQLIFAIRAKTGGAFKKGNTV